MRKNQKYINTDVTLTKKYGKKPRVSFGSN